jgi:hypothetical protein
VFKRGATPEDEDEEDEQVEVEEEDEEEEEAIEPVRFDDPRVSQQIVYGDVVPDEMVEDRSRDTGQLSSNATLGTTPSLEPYVPKPYVPPPCTVRRPGIGNYIVLHDPAIHGSKGGKEIRKRYDGSLGDAIVVPVDPRLAMSEEARRKGRGSAKQRTGLYEISYEVSFVSQFS